MYRISDLNSEFVVGGILFPENLYKEEDMENAMKTITGKMGKTMGRQISTLEEALLHVRKVDLISALSPCEQLDILTNILDTEGTPYYITKAEDGWYLNIDGTFLIPVIVLPK